MNADLAPEHHWTIDPRLQAYFLGAGFLLSGCLAFGILASIFSWNENAIPRAMLVAGGLIGAMAAFSNLFIWVAMLSY